METPTPPDAPSRRQRILTAAFELFMARGYGGTSTLAIASAAKVSKRDLYHEFAGKREILAACVQSRSRQMQAALDLPPPRTREELVAILVRYGIGLRLGVADPQVIATYRLIVAEAPSSPEIGQTLQAEGRMASLHAVARLLAMAQAAGLLGPGPVELMAGQFLSLLVADLILQHLLGQAPPEDATLARGHAEMATAALLRLYPV
jgi:AcrR family transcriptional regulator